MAEQKSQKIKVLKPSWKYFALSYAYSILLIPVFGIGLLSLYFVWNRHRQFRYEVSDAGLKAMDGRYSQHIDLENIQSIKVTQSWLNKKLDVGTLWLQTETRHMKLFGLTHPWKFKDILEEAIEAAKKRRHAKDKTKPRSPSYEPGEMERKNYLTGLWQQGLISDEEFREQTD